MANHPSALKALRQNNTRNQQNRACLSAARTHIKKVETAIRNKEQENAQNFFREAQSFLMKAAKNGIFHKNTVSRKISRLSKKIKLLSA